MTKKKTNLMPKAIAIVVLSVLLVLSMVMGMTGAWFTAESENNTAGEAEINFGKIAITATPTSLSENWTYALPGDSKGISATVALGDDSEGLFFRVVGEAHLVDGSGNDLNLYIDNHQGTKVFANQDLVAGALPNGWASYVYSDATYYYIPKANANSLTLSATITFNYLAENQVYDASGNPVTLNGSAATYKVKVTVGAYAVQARHISGVATEGLTVSNGAITDAGFGNTQKAAIKTEIDALMA